MITVLVCGGRDFQGWPLVDKTLTRILRDNLRLRIIHGACGDNADDPRGFEAYKGADALAHTWAVSHGISVTPYPAAWTTEGKGAGPRRNRRMIEVDRPDMVVAFPGGSGTLDTIRYAQKLSIPVFHIID